MMNSKVYTIIVTYNGMRWIKTCLDSLAEQSKIIIVDNNSTDNTVSFIEENYVDIRVLKQNENLGFGLANNIGIEYAITQNAEYVFLLNQDAYVEGNCVDKLLETAEKQHDLGVLSPVHLNGAGTTLDKYFSFCSSKNTSFNPEETKSIVFDVPMVNAAAWFVPSKVFEVIGGFDPVFFHYGEDHNFCQRLIYHNCKISIVPSIFIRHDREERIKKPIVLFSDAYYNKYEKQLNINFADINISNIELEESIQKNKYLKRIVKNILKLNFKNVKGYYKQYKSIQPIFKLIYKSRNINMKKGSHYLNNNGN